MALCANCSSLELCRLFNGSEVEPLADVELTQRYFWHDNVSYGPCFRHSDDISAIQIAASTGCGLCTMLFDAYQYKNLDAAQEAREFPIILTSVQFVDDEWDNYHHQAPHIAPQLRVSWMSAEHGLLELCDLDISIDATSSVGLTNLPFKPFSKVHPHANDPGCVALARKWLESCLKKHECPAPDFRGADLLTRFLHVGDQSRNPRLVEFPSGTSLQPWVALSYRWGRSEPLWKLKTETAEALKAGIDIWTLDATIRDVLIMTRALGIEYLWVDALCIFQDQESDWSEQSSRMSFIYGNSMLTIVSVDTDAVSESLLKPRKSRSVAIPWVSGLSRGDSQESQAPPQINVSHEWPEHHDELTGPWSARAWTLQEGLLPNRILLYSAHQIAWKCCRVVEYERGLHHEPLSEFGLSIAAESGGRPFWTFDLFSKFKLLPRYLLSPECRTDHDKYRIWYDILEDYSSRDVTRRRDRLVAISGIARMYGMHLPGDRYLAGLWESDIIAGLLWHADGWKLFGSKLGETIDVEVNAPSWSWANAPSGYRVRNGWVNRSLRPLASLKDVSFDLMEPNNPFGSVSHARLTICAPVYRFSRLYHPAWCSPERGLSAFERHLSRVIEFDYGERANEFSHQGCYTALLMAQELASLDHRVDALILQNSTSERAGSGVVLERLGVLELSYYSRSLVSLTSQRLQWVDKSLQYRLNPGRGPRRIKRVRCEDFFHEYKESQWPCEYVTIV